MTVYAADFYLNIFMKLIRNCFLVLLAILACGYCAVGQTYNDIKRELWALKLFFFIKNRFNAFSLYFLSWPNGLFTF